MTVITPDLNPQAPWARRSPKRSLRTWGPHLIAPVLSFFIVWLSPLSGRVDFVVTWVLLGIAVAVALPRIVDIRKATAELVTELFVSLATAVFVGVIAWVLWSAIKPGLASFEWSLLTQDAQGLGVDEPLTKGGMLHAIAGSLIVVTLATVISVPLSILAALYVTEVRGRMVPFVRFMIQAMSGVPSIVAGLFVFAAIVVSGGFGFSGLAGSIALAILMLPTVARTAEEILRLVPDDLRSAALALGGTQARSVWLVVVPAVRSGLMTAAILGVARVAGETAPLLLTAFGSIGTNLNPFSGPMATLPWYIFTQLQLGTDNDVARAWVGALVLLAMVLFFFALARVLANRLRKV